MVHFIVMNAAHFRSAVLAIGCIPAIAGAQCRWEAGESAFPGPNGPVEHLLLWDVDGTGPALENLIVRGSFTVAGDIECPGYAMFDGERFLPLPSPPAGTGGPVAVVGTRLYGTFSLGSEQQLWYWDRDGVHFESVIPAGSSVLGAVRSQLFGVSNGVLCTYQAGSYTPIADPFPADMWYWRTDGQDFAAFRGVGSAYRLVGTHWELADPVSYLFQSVVPWQGGLVWHYSGFVGSNLYESVLTGALSGRSTWSGNGSARLDVDQSGQLIYNVPRTSGQGTDVTNAVILGTGLSATMVDVRNGSVHAAAVFRGRFVIGGDFAECGESGPYMAMETPAGWRSPLPTPIGSCNTVELLDDGTLISLWNRPGGWYGPWIATYKKSGAGWTRISPDVVHSSTDFSPKLYHFGSRTAFWPDDTGVWFQLNGAAWEPFQLHGIQGVPHGDLLLPRLMGNAAWNGLSAVPFPPLATATPRISVNGDLFGNLISTGDWARLDGGQWTDLGPDPSDGRDMTSYHGRPVGMGLTGAVLTFAENGWTPLGPAVLPRAAQHVMAEWNGGLYLAADGIRSSTGVTGLARWNGDRWIGVPGAPTGITSMVASPDGLWIAGSFTSIDGRRTRGLARLLSPCAADLDCSGGVDADDTIAFFAGWDSGSAASDINRDGSVDGDDIIAFFDDLDSGAC